MIGHEVCSTSWDSSLAYSPSDAASETSFINQRRKFCEVCQTIILEKIDGQLVVVVVAQQLFSSRPLTSAIEV